MYRCQSVPRQKRSNGESSTNALEKGINNEMSVFKLGGEDNNGVTRQWNLYFQRGTGVNNTLQ